MTRHRAPAALLLMLAAACAAPSGTTAPEPSLTPVQDAARALPTARLPDGVVVTLELAQTTEEQTGGLMYRASLPENEGMLFLFSNPTYPAVWMKDTWVALDIVFLDESGRVVQVDAEAPPCRDDPCPQYVPREPTLAVLELASGVAARHGVEPGVTLEFDNLSGFPREPGDPPPQP